MNFIIILLLILFEKGKRISLKEVGKKRIRGKKKEAIIYGAKGIGIRKKGIFGSKKGRGRKREKASSAAISITKFSKSIY